MTEPTRQCPKCGERRAESEFSRDRSRSSGYKSLCKPCDRAKSAAYYAANRELKRSGYHEGGGKERKAAAFAANRARAIEIYGGCCIGCGSQTGLEFDHVEEDGKAHRAVEGTASVFRRIARAGTRLPDVSLRLLCFACHRGPGIDSDGPRATTHATAVARTLRALALGPEYAAAASVVEMYAKRLDDGGDDPGIARDLGPKLMDALRALNATPAARSAAPAKPVGARDIAANY